MRHFAHHIGDYAAATAHLSFVEDAAYHRLLRRYYQDEMPLPADPDRVCRLIGARTKEEKKAVEHVLAEFFQKESDGYHQRRADREIEVYRAKVEIARENGVKGGRPRNLQKTHPVMPSAPSEKLTTPHSPLTSIHKEEDNSTSRKPLSADKRGSRLSEDWQPSAEDLHFANDLGLDGQLTADEFRDYWTSLPGARGRKLDWSKTFKNRCRELGKRPGPQRRDRDREIQEAIERSKL